MRSNKIHNVALFTQAAKEHFSQNPSAKWSYFQNTQKMTNCN